MAGPVYSFGPFHLEAQERRLTRDGTALSLPGKAFDTLLLLVEGAGSLAKQEAEEGAGAPETPVVTEAEMAASAEAGA